MTSIRFASAGTVVVVALSLMAAGPAAAAPVPAATVPQGVYFPETFTLANGLQVIVVTNRRVPVVSHMVWYKMGAADTPRGKGGIAHFLEHLMFKGTKTLKPGEFSRIVARNGGDENAFTSWDYTAFFQNVAVDRLELVMGMEADRMQNLQLSDAEVAPEREVVREERRQRTDNHPGARLAEALQATLFVHHPYGQPVLGWGNEIPSLTRQDALDFYRTWYAPNNAVVVVSGDISAAELRPLAERTYGRVPARAVPARHRVEEPRLDVERRVILRDAEVRQPALRKLWPAPSYHHGDSRHAYALQVLDEILGGSTGRLYRHLVVDRHLATSVGTDYQPDVLDLASFGVSASPTPGTTVDALEAALDAELAQVATQGVTAAEVAEAKQRLEREAILARDSLRGPAYAFGLALATGGTIATVEDWPARIDAVTPEAVDQAATLVLGQKGSVVGLLLPAEPGDAAPGPAPAANSVPGAGGAIR